MAADAGAVSADAAAASSFVDDTNALTREAKVLSGDESQLADITQRFDALCSRNSFSGKTAVLMADGTSKPIDQIQVGDKVANNLPGVDSGTKNQARTVTAIHITYTDRDYTDVTIITAHGPATITGTAHHPYWDVTTQAWTDADQLHAGDKLQTSHGNTAAILALRDYTAMMVTYNLTIDTLHTYYVEAGSTPVLVHNAPISCGFTSPASLQSHFADHGSDLGHYLVDDYEQAALDFVNGPRTGVRVKESMINGQTYMWNPSTNEFATYETRSGNIITYFDSSIKMDGSSSNAYALQYWNKQPGIEGP